MAKRLNIVSTQLEEITRKLHGKVDPALLDIILKIADDQRTMQHAIDDIFKELSTMVEALQLTGKAMHKYNDRINKLYSRYSEIEGTEGVTTEDPKSD